MSVTFANFVICCLGNNRTVMAHAQLMKIGRTQSGFDPIHSGSISNSYMVLSNPVIKSIRVRSNDLTHRHLHVTIKNMNYI